MGGSSLQITTPFKGIFIVETIPSASQDYISIILNVELILAKPRNCYLSFPANKMRNAYIMSVGQENDT